ncbi:MAG: benzoyl-CoA reductase subunit A [Deltaproteobacteria bacterium]|nr:benzoyl-CoA reductase subunit A [Deltaproteobacteria bacterium]
MRVCVGVDLGSTTTKAILIDEEGKIVGKGITNSRSNYEVASAVARDEAVTSARFNLLARKLEGLKGEGATEIGALDEKLRAAFRLELYLDELAALRQRVTEVVAAAGVRGTAQVKDALAGIFDRMTTDASALFLGGDARKSDFFRDIAGAAFMHAAEKLANERGMRFEELTWPFDRAILDVETELRELDFAATLGRAARRIAGGLPEGAKKRFFEIVDSVGTEPIDEVAFSGTGYGRQTLPFPKAAVRSEILCHGRGAHRYFPGTRTVLDIGGQDTKAIQVDDKGVVTTFQMNDRCAAGCGRYLGYIADELNLGLHELGPLALKSCKSVRINSTCTVFAGAELRERLSLGEEREDILAGLHKAIMLRAMSLLARSGGVKSELTFTGGVCKNDMATKVLRELVDENYGSDITLNAHPDSIYMGALGAAMFALDDLRAGKANLLVVKRPDKQAMKNYANPDDACASCG